MTAQHSYYCPTRVVIRKEARGWATPGTDAKTGIKTYSHWPKGVGGLKKLEKPEKKIPKASE